MRPIYENYQEGYHGNRAISTTRLLKIDPVSIMKLNSNGDRFKP